MRLTVVGCSGSTAGPDSPASCYLLEAEGFALVLDLGSGAAGPLARHVDLTTIGAVLLSHLHADHMLDLTGLQVALEHGPYDRPDPVPVLGPAGTAARLAEVFGVRNQTGVAELAAVLAVTEIGPGTWPVGPFTVTARRVVHPVEAYAYRVEHAGRTLAYSGDCAPCPGLDEITRGADLALVEAAFVDGPANLPGLHHTGREAGELAERCGVGRLVVTHVPPWHDREAAAEAARSAYAGEVVVARPGDVHEV